MKLPKAKTSEVVVQNLESEVLVYDLRTDQVFCLNETLAKVFNACDGKSSFDELKRTQKLTDEIIYLALDELKKNDLLVESNDYNSPFAGISRREVIKKVGFATIITLPLITSLTAPQAAHAASSNAIGACQSCSLANPQCASGNCAVRTRPDGVNGAYCSAASDRNIVLLPGDSFGANSQQECDTQAANYCCAGNGATFNSKPGAINPCKCNA